MTDRNRVDLDPRSYQTEIVEQAKSKNLIVCLPTGSGKTYIAVMLIKELLPMTRQSLADGGKRTIILVKTVELGRQHYNTIDSHLKLEIIAYADSPQIRLQDREKWMKIFEKYKILIFTAQTYVNLLQHGLCSLNQVNLLIFDECHHASGNDPYTTVMKQYDARSDSPRILGLTASISGQKLKPKDLQKAAGELEKMYHAQIETGSDRDVIIQNSTSVKVQHDRCDNYKQYITVKKRTEVMNIFKIAESLRDELDKYLKSKTQEVEMKNDTSKIADQSVFISLHCRTLKQLKSHLDNIIHIGDDLGFQGFLHGIIALNKHLKANPLYGIISDEVGKSVYNNIKDKLNSIINTNTEAFTNDQKIKYSDKVMKVKEYIINNQDSQCIVFVERVYTAAFLCQVLREIFEGTKKIQYISGSKAYIDEISVSKASNAGISNPTTDECDVVKMFRKKTCNVLVSTAIIEEGLDVPECNLVIRFNKPQNLSSYLQSKGRARKLGGNALFVVLRDEATPESYALNKEEYLNYECIEKLLKNNFKSEHDFDPSSNGDDNLLKPYQTQKVKIDAIRAIEIIYQYCAVLGTSTFLSPQFYFSSIEHKNFQCILTMPINCPITEPVICANKTKKLAKQECCLTMVKMLCEKNELDEYCLPIILKRRLKTDHTFGDDPGRSTLESIDIQISYLFHTYNHASTDWYLYRINISDNDDLGFVIPVQLKSTLPHFTLYGRDKEFIVEIHCVKVIDIQECTDQLETFCQYIFEEVFDAMNIKLESILQFDLQSSTYKLLPCLLTKSDDIDYQRMRTICERNNKSITHPSELNDNEVYYISYMSDRQFFRSISDQSLLKRSTDKREDRKSDSNDESYAEYFEQKVPGIRVQENHLATVKDFRKPRIDYLKDATRKKDKESISGPSYFVIEVVRYAPLNQEDFELIYKLPSILIRLSQLYYVEQLRQLLSPFRSISYAMSNDDDKLPITFTDCLETIFSSSSSTALPLTCFRYDFLLQKKSRLQPPPELLFQAITRRAADENTDMENLEILGDCFLKLAMSLSLFHQYPTGDAGKLTTEKDWFVSNLNLYQLAMKKGLQNYLNAHKPIYSGNQANWMPPGYKVDANNAEKYMKGKVKRKAIADMIEALIGCYLVSTDYITTLKFMQWLDLKVIPINDADQMEIPPVLRPGLIDTMPDVINQVNAFFINQEFDKIEKEINYIFKNKAYLIAAFTHASYVNNRLTQCYERLEYLGDAVLDFLVIRCLFIEHYKHVTPSRVTNLRQDLSNNGRLAYILYSSMTERSEKQATEEQDIYEWADSTAPKPLADVFEALVGAIFIDCGYSLDTVWKVIEPLLRQYIDQSIKKTNINPIRTVFEKGGKYLKQTTDDRKTGTQTYADYYERITPNIYIQADWIMSSMKAINKLKLSLNIREYEIYSSDQTIYYYPIEVLYYAPLNQRDFQLISMLPSILVRIVQLYHLERLRKLLAVNLNSYPSTCKCSMDDHLIHQQPSVDILFQAITRCAAHEQVNLENLEALGDCFLKFAVSMSLYYQFPSATIILHGNDSNWLPPGYVTKSKDQKKYTHQIVKRKAFADMIEALIGAFLISSSYMTTIRFMQWLGLNVIPLDEKDCIMSIPSIIDSSLMNEINRIFQDEGFSEIEEKLQYSFRNKAYLISAFTHPSKTMQCNGISYERLQFLGDALLDFLVIRHAFLHYDKHVTPGRLTDIRQDLPSNNRLGYILVLSQLHTKIRYHSNELSQQIQTYVNTNISTKAPKVFADVFEKFTDETGAICLVQMADGSMYEGHGQNKNQAKSDACQKALKRKN
ncbi:hypothetical protein I4U23_029586 [Adineta vaga]|nr:hypothetical protein I4U23_029586 [Adineta vaga]